MPPIASRPTPAERQEPPFCIQIELTEGCNLRCPFCGLNGIRGSANNYKFLTVDLADHLARMIRDEGWTSRIEFAMHGEPTMNPRHLECVAAFREHLPKHHLMMTSNGGGLLRNPTEQIDALLCHLNVLALDWYENVLIVPKILDGYGGGYPVRRYPQDVDANPHTRRRPTERLLVVVQDIEKATRGTHSTLNNHAGCGAPTNDSAAGKRCAKPFRELSVRWDGTVAVCCNDWRGLYRCGDLRTQTLNQVWQSPAFVAARRKLYHGMRDFGPCAGCDALSYRPGLLPDKTGRGSVPLPSQRDEEVIRKALGEGPLTLPVLRPWEAKNE